jgi:hypothetical protein
MLPSAILIITKNGQFYEIIFVHTAGLQATASPRTQLQRELQGAGAHVRLGKWRLPSKAGAGLGWGWGWGWGWGLGSGSG